jgi:PAS domain S-box-containing protein
MKKEILKYIKQITVLYVEDNYHTREELEFFLNNKVFKLYVAKNGEEGFELYKKVLPELVITDVQMPKLDGIGMSKLIKDFDPHARIIVLTAFNDNEFLFEAIKLNIDSYITKPLDIRNLIDVVSKLAKSICLEKENKEIYNTLKQYKDIVDERSIISKTNKNGIITYVNKPFELISGYSKDELIGKTHSIIKHEDTHLEHYEDMWGTILNKNIWSGIIKNKKKNGDYYIVDTLIKPILDIDGNIVEFISLTNDITDLENTKEYFKKQNIKVSSDLKESIRLSRAYEEAIDQSNIILRISTDRKITYANEEFYKISGYTKDELIGKPYSLLKDPSIDIAIYEKRINELESYLNKGKVYKGKVSNKAKDGTIFHCKHIIFPLRDKDDKIVEYMGVRHDITEIENLHSELEETQREIIYKLGELGETRSKETGNHVKRVAEYSKLVSEKLGLPEEEVKTLFTASPMHDIGKVGIPDSVLNKPGRLTDEEWLVMKSHAEIGYKILNSSTRSILKAAAIVSYTHHEKWDGSGYPLGLKGEEIDIFGRITAIADVFDALGSDRAYKKAWPLEKTLEFFQSQSGKHFEPKLVNILFDNLGEFIGIRDKYKD